MAFLLADCDEQSNFYAVDTSGNLFFYKDEARNGQGVWANGGQPQKIGQGWQSIRQLICADDGVIYAIDASGDLVFYQDQARNGTGVWAFGGAGQILSSGGWDNYARVFNGGAGILYAIETNGDLYFYRDLARTGTPNWANNGIRQKIGRGWTGIRDVAYGGDGQIYAVTADGDLLWYQDLARNGAERWANGGQGRQIGQGWTGAARLLSGQGGILYGITPDGRLNFYQDQARNGTGTWANGGQPQQIGEGWFVGWQNTATAGYLAGAQVAGYASPMSAAPGETVSFYVSALTSYTVTYTRLKVTAGGVGNAVAPPFAGAAITQSTTALPWQNGCGWNETFALTIPEDWQSGIYSAQCVDTTGAASHILFVVKPADRLANFAVLTSTNTLNAYNAWGGRSKYVPNNHGIAVSSFLRPNALAAPVDAQGNGYNGWGLAEFWTLNWLEDAGYNFDVYTDQDFESGIPEPLQYDGVILNAHPEYWSDTMLAQLQAFLAGGGNLVYLGGNGLFERCVTQDGGQSLLFYDGNPPAREPHFFRNANPPQPERGILGVGFLFDNSGVGHGPPNAAPYQVVDAAHRFFRNTGLTHGAPFGIGGRNGPASGWEMDSSAAIAAPDGAIVTAYFNNDRGAPPANIQLLAVGMNGGSNAANMVYYRHPGGGIVFSVGSLNFTGSLADDPTLQRIVANVLDECLNPSIGAGQ